MPTRSLFTLLLLSFSLPVPAALNGSHVQVLAASCAACHGTDGNSVGGTPVLAGLDRSHFIRQMQAFRDGSRASTVMHHHAKGLTADEVDALAAYFAAQPRVSAPALVPQGAQ
jgi:cytochrome c553